MALLMRSMDWLFNSAWCVGVAAQIYASRFFFPLWVAGFRNYPKHKGYGRKAMVGYGISAAAVLVGFAASALAGLVGRTG